MLLIAGALLLRGLERAHQIDPGFDPDRLVNLTFNLKMNGYSLEQATAFQRRVVDRLQAQPGVEAVTLVSRPPPGLATSTWRESRSSGIISRTTTPRRSTPPSWSPTTSAPSA